MGKPPAHSHSVMVDRSVSPPAIRISDIFNLSVALVDRHLQEGRKDKIAFKWRNRELTYGALADGVFRTANALSRIGIRRGDRVLISLTDTPEFYFAFLGAARVGAIAVLVSTFLRQNEYEYILGESRPRVIFASSITFGALRPAIECVSDISPTLIAGDEAPEPWISARALISSVHGESFAVDTSPGTECFWLYSSGSTGEPKAAVHAHKDLIYTAVLYAQGILDLSERDTVFSVGKLFFAYGINNSLGFPLWVGASAILLEDRVSAENTLEIMEKLQPTVYFSVPTMISQQTVHMESNGAVDLSALRACVCGGEILTPALADRWKAMTNLPLIEGMGSSEALHIYTSNILKDPRVGTIGPVVPGYEAKIIKENGEQAETEEIGEIVIRGPSVAKHYFNKPEKTAQCMRDGWFLTGDNGYEDSEGYFYFSGRKDDMLRVGSMWVSPFEIESVLSKHPAVLEVAVVGEADHEQLAKPKAYIVLREGFKPDPSLQQSILQHAAGQLSRHKQPRSIVFMTNLPKTATGKIQRFRLRRPII